MWARIMDVEPRAVDALPKEIFRSGQKRNRERPAVATTIHMRFTLKAIRAKLAAAMSARDVNYNRLKAVA